MCLIIRVMNHYLRMVVWGLIEYTDSKTIKVIISAMGYLTSCNLTPLAILSQVLESVEEGYLLTLLWVEAHCAKGHCPHS